MEAPVLPAHDVALSPETGAQRLLRAHRARYIPRLPQCFEAEVDGTRGHLSDDGVLHAQHLPFGHVDPGEETLDRPSSAL
jgi:hypothetical protein